MAFSKEQEKTMKALIGALKVSKESKDVLYRIALEIEDSYRDALSQAEDEINMWKRFFLDKPEDRLWHASDKTWWARHHGKRPKKTKGIVQNDYALWKAEPPPEIQELLKASTSVVEAFFTQTWGKEGEGAKAINRLANAIATANPNAVFALAMPVSIIKVGKDVWTYKADVKDVVVGSSKHKKKKTKKINKKR